MNIPDLVKNDPYLKPHLGTINLILSSVEAKEKEICGDKTLDDFANAHLYFGLHKHHDKWVYRDKLPAADKVYLVGDFNNWEINEDFRLYANSNGDFQRDFPLDTFHHLQKYRIFVMRNGETAYRVPAFARWVHQDPESLIFNAQVWDPPKPYKMKYKSPKPKPYALIYEAHIGMSSEEGKVATFNEFRELMLPRIAAAGYETIQLMAIQEHPYYGSFGYHVANFYAVTSRFGTPDELKQLIDEAHRLKLRVIMDIVHSHAVKNEVEGIGKYDLTEYLYFHEGPRGLHPAWDSRCFNYAKPETLNFLLSNCKYWLLEYNFDGFRFDGVTSMLYKDHGLGVDFVSYDMYFSENTDIDAAVYMALANKLIKTVRPDAITIAEDTSGFPGIASPLSYGGIGFDYRLAMGSPDYWIKIIKELPDEKWHVGDMFYQLSNKRADEKVIGYAESHDQALVGDKTIMFRLADKEMYYSMHLDYLNLAVERSVALHKMIRLLTLATAGNGYLNFMGNEFGHPEWIDFPREGNNWSYHYARRQWSLAQDPKLAYYYLNLWDQDMIALAKSNKIFDDLYPFAIVQHTDDMVLAFKRNGILFVFNFNPTQSFTDYGFDVPKGKYKVILNSDNGKYLGHNRIDEEMTYETIYEPVTKKHYLRLYVVNRTVIALKPIK